jgi:site-specific DNA recombinase
MDSAWSNGKPAYRCRHGHTSTAPPDPDRAKNAYVREDRILARLPALYLLLTGAQGTRGRTRRRTRKGADVRPAISTEEVLGYLRKRQISLTWDPASAMLRAGTSRAIKTVTGKAS